MNLGAEFPLDKDLLYLNHAAVGVWPKRTAEAVKAFADENMHRGAAGYLEWLKVERELRGRLKRLINADSVDDIALSKNTSEALSLIAYGLDWQAGDNIVTSNQEFPSNRIVWESLKERGVELRLADISVDDPEAAMLALCDEKTRLLSVSSVQYGTGLRMDLNRLGQFCHDQNVLFCVDAIQSLGAIEFDAQACHADFVVADGHKWMLGPEGLAVFYSRPEAREKLKLSQFGWHMVERAGEFDAEDWTPAKSARRFEPGSPNMLGIYALNASLSLFEEIGMDVVEKAILDNAQQLIDWVDSKVELELISPSEKGRFAGIVTFRKHGLNRDGHAELYRNLMAEGVICANRSGGIRFSPHFYSDMSGFEVRLRPILD
ncbi:aminotransferase class V-fold PLP-dependent enzyme [Mariprofundus sp. KV]|uniref:aminotransferase class V-fold PLP-dependent enzyme n=1 Tax=Mariprofundus sp. KV TaxID=2608715 RepID=UPI0015A1704D|nr:aminotransferase class V-fold PLP-dependent enzyme [Mariprofundus sp. KV]NWF36999.1 aminotransferase class V-fold PLP-dependent enzyme [Mariprofundus sp. KV]